MNRRGFLSLLAVVLSAAALAAAEHDLVDIQSVNPRIRVELPYATNQNFVGVAVYRTNKAFLRKPVAAALSAVQETLEKKGFGLKIWDAYRPLSVQKRFWELVPDERYVASPAKGSRHNRGAAVDLTLVDSAGRELEMPTKFDDFTARAGALEPDHTPAALTNRKTLQDAMLAHGFVILPTEWWHFDYAEWKGYTVLDIPIEDLAVANADKK